MLKRIDISGGPEQSLCQFGPFRGGTWGSAGVIVFGPRPRGVLYQIPIGGGTPKPVTSLDAGRGEIVHEFPQFLPDGRHFLHLAVSSRPGESSIRVGSLDSTDSKFLVNAKRVEPIRRSWGNKRLSSICVWCHLVRSAVRPTAARPTAARTERQTSCGRSGSPAKDWQGRFLNISKRRTGGSSGQPGEPPVGVV
jgi:hypothetical protein